MCRVHWYGRSILLGLAVMCSVACSTAAQAAIVIHTAALSGPNESPPVNSPGIGNVVITINDVANTMRVQASFSGLLGPTTNAHIHAAANATPFTGTSGVATTLPTFAGFPSGVTSGTYDNTFDLTLPSSWNPAYVTNNGGTTATAQAALLAAMASGRAYFNIHTTLFTGGEIRGFLVPVPEPGSMALAGTFALGALGHAWRKRRAQKAA